MGYRQMNEDQYFEKLEKESEYYMEADEELEAIEDVVNEVHKLTV